ncbi:hypothetical protein CEY16_01650 [Halalkalibacillus sediminis]|uniref:UPF0223 protein CEY16_01650 n=1 Tax=Halalkalibacillus sediminis TaxID=2018042 RepID=A0A2I0QVX4_9BACI|nr:UPF0223 family protein [Halalkalibacillus sediminis]PKR78487.1 hypothetical protein CEY16_01650 [Halalkalibacillus sediminis]
MEYNYPLDMEWSKEEMMEVIDFYQIVERAYESKAKKEEIMEKYNKFKKIVPSKSEEKTLCKDFEKQSGYVPYRVVQAAKKDENNDFIIMKK